VRSSAGSSTRQRISHSAACLHRTRHTVAACSDNTRTHGKGSQQGLARIGLVAGAGTHIYTHAPIENHKWIRYGCNNQLLHHAKQHVHVVQWLQHHPRHAPDLTLHPATPLCNVAFALGLRSPRSPTALSLCSCSTFTFFRSSSLWGHSTSSARRCGKPSAKARDQPSQPLLQTEATDLVGKQIRTQLWQDSGHG
jgi:hypothetical protein